jgi:hypothetical protein
MNIQSKWVMGGILVAVLIVGCTLGAVAVTLFQRTMWGYSPAYAANFIPNRMGPAFSQMQGHQDYSMPGPMMRGGPRGGGPMMYQHHMEHGPYGFGPKMMAPGMGRDFGPILGDRANSLVSTVAKQLDMTPDELATELQSGKTVADLAEEKDVSLDSIIEALLAPHTERMQLMVENDVISQEQADAMIAAMEAQVAIQLSSSSTFGGPGMGRGMMWR